MIWKFTITTTFRTVTGLVEADSIDHARLIASHDTEKTLILETIDHEIVPRVDVMLAPTPYWHRYWEAKGFPKQGDQ